MKNKLLSKLKNKKMLIIACTLLAVTIVVVLFLVLHKKETFRNVFVNDYTGSVSLERKESTMEISRDMKLIPEDAVSVEEESILDLLVDDDKHIAVLDNSKIVVESEGNPKKGFVQINVVYGQTIVDIENKLKEDDDFIVSTPNATISVRGTIFSVKYNDTLGITRVDVKEGIVEVVSNSGDMITLNAGEACEVIDTGITTKTLNDAEIDAIFTKNDDGSYGNKDSIANASVRDVVTFGTWEGNPIEWYVLDKDDSSATLLSKYVLVDHSTYDQTMTDVWMTTWAECELRNWLNDEFYNTAFASREQERILITTCVDNDNPYYGKGGKGQFYEPGEDWYPAGGKSTQDKVYILSVEELERYLEFDINDYDSYRNGDIDFGTYSSICNENSGGILVTTRVDDDIKWDWWLRTVGRDNTLVTQVFSDGCIDLIGSPTGAKRGVRPVIRVGL